MAYKNNLITGITELLVLAILEKKDSYVYEIRKSIADNSEGLLSISLNTIYTATYKLAEENMISEYSQLVGKKRQRIYYHLETRGKEHLERISAEYAQMTEGVKKVLDSLEGGDMNVETV
ncbi:MAG: PadR family transcriptional regulator [Ruminococcus flavefaciens]|nr:PadR family transcriptional regulator [Ruminococcus flavefaciens]